MSACWASRPPRAAALAATLLVVLALPAAAARRSAPDSLRHVRSIRVSDEGIRIGEGGGDTTLQVESGTVVTVGDQGIRVRRGGAGHDLRVVGPVVLVDGQGSDMVRVFSDAEVPAGKRVEGDVVAVFGSVTVRGQVSGNAVAVFGGVHLAPGAEVDGDAVAVGGRLQQEPGASVSGQSVSIDTWPERGRIPGMLFGMTGLLTLILLAVLVPVLGGWLFFLVAPNRMLRAAVTATQRPFVSLLLGLVSGPLLLIAIVLLLITVVGIPIALLLPLLFAVLAWAGHVATLYVVGCRLLRRPLGARGTIGPYLAGTMFVAVLLFAGLLGLALPGLFKPIALFVLMLALLLIAGLGLIGTGAVLLSKLGATPRDLEFAREASGAPPATVPQAGAAS